MIHFFFLFLQEIKVWLTLRQQDWSSTAEKIKKKLVRPEELSHTDDERLLVHKNIYKDFIITLW